MHLVSVNRGQRLVSMTISGFVHPAEVAAAATDLHAAIRRLGGEQGTHVTLYDLSNVDIAGAETIAQFRNYFVEPRFASIWARKVALVTQSALFALQLKRVRQERTNIRTFASRSGALTWLLAA